MVVHHSGHEMERARGSSAFKGAMDQEFQVKGTSGLMELKVTKMKDAEMPEPRRFKIVQVGLGVLDSCDVEITGAYIKVDGNPLDFQVGSRINGQPIKALDVVKLMHPTWPGAPAMATGLGCSERALSNIMRSMANAGMAVQSSNRKAGWALTEDAIDHLSMTGQLAIEAQEASSSVD
jgi:hypothetical protein